ncbi:hypothetical protein EVAR_95783_1 [Eumeta japonica]|uniref:Uncharacterized protein n=1 Tax=Eumeta variegata TaxID=151549 RepID=A0A4C1THI9_EUMVA|nr:hypothetical protein EVAR_95783_1 [Eumeta japonica]
MQGIKILTVASVGHQTMLKLTKKRIGNQFITEIITPTLSLCTIQRGKIIQYNANLQIIRRRSEYKTLRRAKRRCSESSNCKVARSQESEEQTQTRQMLDSQRHATPKSSETYTRTQACRTLDAERHASQRASETFTQTQARQALDAERHASQRAAETVEQTQTRRVLDAERHAIDCGRD